MNLRLKFSRWRRRSTQRLSQAGGQETLGSDPMKRQATAKAEVTTTKRRGSREGWPLAGPSAITSPRLALPRTDSLRHEQFGGTVVCLDVPQFSPSGGGSGHLHSVESQNDSAPIPHLVTDLAR
jgi:hypothetical protein